MVEDGERGVAGSGAGEFGGGFGGVEVGCAAVLGLEGDGG